MFQDVDLGRVDALIEDKLACLVNIKIRIKFTVSR